MKTLILTGAVLLAASAASAADVDVVVDPDAENEIIVRQVDQVPTTGLADTDNDGMLSADEIADGDGAEAVFGFEPDAVIRVRPGEEGDVTIIEAE